ncbi:MAG: hypothetical protein V1862_03345, partial [Methanobacteriota archaeon]
MKVKWRILFGDPGEIMQKNYVYIQGGASTVTNGSDGNMVITIQDVIPYFNLAYRDKSHLTPIEQLTKVT